MTSVIEIPNESSRAHTTFMLEDDEHTWVTQIIPGSMRVSNLVKEGAWLERNEMLIYLGQILVTKIKVAQLHETKEKILYIYVCVCVCVCVCNMFEFALGCMKDQQEFCSNTIDKILKFSVLLSLTVLSQYLITSLGTSPHLLHHVQLFLKCRHLSMNGASNVAPWIFYTLAQIWYDVLVRCVSSNA